MVAIAGPCRSTRGREALVVVVAPRVDSRLGACEALAVLKGRARAAVPALRRALSDEHLWLRIKAAEALGSIGAPAAPAIPDLLTMLAQKCPETDPRGMQQRYLCVVLFSERVGMLRRSLDGVDRDLLHEAVIAGLGNEDGAARATFATVYRNLSFREIEPLLPHVHQAVVEPAPSGIMFADNIRLSGLELLAAHRIEEGIPLCADLIDVERWGLNRRIRRCLKALANFGGAAHREVPRLRQLEGVLLAKGWKRAEIDTLNIPGIIAAIEEDHNPAPTRKLNAAAGVSG